MDDLDVGVVSDIQHCIIDVQAGNQEFDGIVKEWIRCSLRINWG